MIVFAVLAVITVGVVAVALYFVFKGDDHSASSRAEPGPRSRTTSQPRSSGNSPMVRKPAQASNVPRPAPPQKARPVTAASPQPSRTPQRWKVVAPGDDHDGQIGTADPVDDYDDEFVYLKFSGDAETYAFRHGEVTTVTSGSQAPVTPAPGASLTPRPGTVRPPVVAEPSVPTSAPSNASDTSMASQLPREPQHHKLVAFWHTTEGKVLAALMTILLLGLGGISLYIAQENRHSYQVGHHWGRTAGVEAAIVKGGVEVESYCESGFVASGYGPAGIARDPFFDGCRDAVAEFLSGGG